MASEFFQKQREDLSSFWDREVAGPARETYLWLKNQAVGYLNLGKETMASRPGIEFKPIAPADTPGTPEYGALRRAMVLSGGAASFLGLCDYLFRYLPYVAEHGSSEGFSVIPGFNNPPEASVGGAGFSSGSGSVASETPGATPSPTATATETPTQTPTGTATEAPTETQTATPMATERIRPTEKPLAGELFRLDCRELPWSKCWEELVKALEPLLGQGGTGGQSFSRVNKLSFNLGEEKGTLDYVVKRYYSPQAVGVIILDWIAPDGETRSDEVFVFKVRENGREAIVPALPLSGSAGADDNSVGIFWSVGTASASGAVMSSDVTTSRELAKKLFEEKLAVHGIAVVQEAVNFQLGDQVAELFYSQPGSPEKDIQPIRLVVEFGLKPTP